ncbi:MAG: bifunctional methionine sulfoxide reductase B/A protein [Bacteroidales bacterium]|nr:bifunctional methionine sulfoxide reductase B/A protein [Bacteroidales bacterium]
MTYNPLHKFEQEVILHKATEKPFSSSLLKIKEPGTFLCKQCNQPLFYTRWKFDSGTGWPSFDDVLKEAVILQQESDGRTEVQCSRCHAHLGHLFVGEGFTSKMNRYCINGIALRFIPKEINYVPERAIFAAGCFWGVEYFFRKAPGVISAISGYTGGQLDFPTYEDVKTGKTGHFESVEVFFNPNETTFENLIQLFFEIHDFSQEDGQGPDIGEQYRSAIFYLSNAQKSIAENYVNILKEKGYHVATQLIPASVFWEAENYHQNYYYKIASTPYCHFRRKIFG